MSNTVSISVTHLYFFAGYFIYILYLSSYCAKFLLSCKTVQLSVIHIQMYF